MSQLLQPVEAPGFSPAETSLNEKGLQPQRLKVHFSWGPLSQA